MTSPVTQALTAIVKAAPARHNVWEPEAQSWYDDRDADFAVFSYKRDFAALWGLGETTRLAHVAGALAKRADREYTLIIVWDGMPSSSTQVVGVDSYVTPYEWAATLSLVLYRQRQVAKPKLRVLILDLNPHKASGSFVKQSLYGFHNTFPWIQEYRPVGEGEELIAEVAQATASAFPFLRQAIPPKAQGGECLLNDLLRPQDVLTTFAELHEEQEAPLEIFVESWRQQFFKPGNRHHVSNLIGPLVLAKGLPIEMEAAARELIEGESDLRRALEIILQEIGVLNLSGKNSDTIDCGIHDDAGPFGRRKGVRFLLIDDLYEGGFHHILGFLLLGDKYRHHEPHSRDSVWEFDAIKDVATLRCSSSHRILGSAFAGVMQWDLPRKLAVDADVLLLDLRLWPSDDRELSARKTVLNEILGWCNKIGAQRITDEHFQNALREASKLVNGEPADELTALALLPLLISHYDAAFPIVVFSSTHQRDVIKRFGHRPNIITSFAKPLLAGYGVSKPEQALEDLAFAIKKAIEQHEARTVWERFCKPGFAWLEPYPPFKTQNPNPSPPAEVAWTWDQKKKAYFSGGLSFYPQKLAKSETILRMVAFLYKHYILEERYFDFAPILWELVEGALTPKEVAEKGGDTRFKLEGSELSNRLLRCLQNCRNKKVHGHAPYPRNANEIEKWRIASLVLFHLWLDWYRGVVYDFPRHKELALRITESLRTKYDLQGIAGGTGEFARKIAANEKVSWEEFLACQAACAISLSGDREDKVSCSAITIKAVQYIVENLDHAAA